MKNKNKLIALLLSTAFIMSILGCIQIDDSTDDSNETNSSKATVPAEATALTTTDISSDSITLSWTAPTDFGKSADDSAAILGGYDVYYAIGATATTSDTKANTTSITNATTLTVSELAGDTSYAFIVVTTNSAGKTSNSASVIAKTLSGSTAPAEATALTTTDISSDSITLSWTAPTDFGKANDGNTAATLSGYDVYYTIGAIATTSNTKANASLLTDTSITVSGLDAFKDYAFLVVTTNSVGKTSEASTTAKTLPGSTAPSEATALTTTDISADSITLSWTAPTDFGKSADDSAAILSGYDVYYATGATATTSDTKVNASLLTTTTVIISELDAFKDYAFLVVTTNSASKTSEASTTAKTLSGSTAPSEATALTTTDISADSITLSWTAPTDFGKADDGNTAATLSGYDVYYATGAIATTNDAKVNASLLTTTTVIISELDAFKDYAFLVVTTNSASKTSEASTTAKTLSGSTAPTIATALTTTNITVDSITLSWTVPTDFGKMDNGTENATLTNYTVYYVAGSTVTANTANVQTKTITGTPSTTIGNLTGGVEYAFIVVTANSASKTSTSEVVIASTIAADIDFNDLELTYDTSVVAVFSAEKTYVASTNIPTEASATYAITARSPTTNITGITIDDSSIRVGSTIAQGTYNLTVTASTTADGYTGNKIVDVTVTVGPPNALTGSLSYSSHVFYFNTTVTITDAQSPTSTPDQTVVYTTTDTTFPAGLQFDNATGKLYGAPTRTTGTVTYTVTATGTAAGYVGSTMTGTIQVRVKTADLGKASLAYTNVTGTVGTAISDITPTWTVPDDFANDPPLGNMFFGISPTLPDGLSFSTFNGTISGTPNETIDDTFTVTATGFVGFSPGSVATSEQFTIKITN